MSSIFGTVHLDQSEIDVSKLQVCAATLRHRGDVVFEKAISPSAFISLRANRWAGDLAGTDHGRETFVSFEGRSTEQAQVVVHQDRVSLVRDPVGMRPLYFWWDRRAVIFASEIRAILTHPRVKRAVDWIGLAGHSLGEASIADLPDTCFENIYSVPPGHRAEFRLGEAVELKCDWDFSVAVSDMDFKEACVRFRELFLHSVEKRVAGTPTAVSVSGGLDSSAIFCAARYLGHRVQGLSYISAQPDRDEREFLRDIERHYDCKIAQFPIGEIQSLGQDIAQQIGIVEAPLVDYLWQTTRTIHAMALQSGAGQLLSGHWGDQVLFATGYLADLMREGRWITAAQHLMQFDHWLVSGFSRREARHLAREVFKSLLPAEWVVRIAHWRKAHRAETGVLKWPRLRPTDRPSSHYKNSFGSWQARRMYQMVRSKHFTHCLEWSNKVSEFNGVRLGFPMLDRDLLQFLISLPGDLQNHGGVPRAILRESLKGIVPESILLRNWKADFSDVVNQSAREDLARIIPRLLKTRLPSQLVPNLQAWKNEIEELSTQLDGDECSAAWRLYDLLALTEIYQPSSPEVQHGENKSKENSLPSAEAQ